MNVLFAAFKGKNNTSAQLAERLSSDTLLLTNSFLSLEKDLHSATQCYDAAFLFGVDKSLNGTVRIERAAEMDNIWVWSQYDIDGLSLKMHHYGIEHHISDVPTQYLCNAAYYRMLSKNKQTVLIHIPSLKGMDDTLMDRLTALFQHVDDSQDILNN